MREHEGLPNVYRHFQDVAKEMEKSLEKDVERMYRDREEAKPAANADAGPARESPAGEEPSVGTDER